MWPDGSTTAFAIDDDLIIAHWYRERRFPVVRGKSMQIRIVQGNLRLIAILTDYRIGFQGGDLFFTEARKTKQQYRKFYHESARHDTDSANHFRLPIERPDPLDSDFHFAGLSYQHSLGSPSRQFRNEVSDLAIPFWMPVLPIALLSVVIAPFRFRRPPRGLCQNCNYDLRASTDKCPECGTPIPPRDPESPPPASKPSP
jgi:hypothetical protein